MSKVFTQGDTNAPLGVIQACAPVAPAADADAKEAVSGGTAGVTAVACAVGSASSELCYADELRIADTDSLDAGTLTHRLNVSTAQANLTLEDIYVCRVNSSGVSQETLGSVTALGTDISAGGVFTTNITLSAASAHNAGDRVYITVVVANSHDHTSRTIEVLPDQNIDTPFTAAASTAGEVTDAASVRVALPGDVTSAGSVRSKVWSHVTSAASVAAALAGLVTSVGSVDAAVPLERTNSGLLARYVANDADDPFVATDWEEGANVTSTSVDGTTGRLILTPNGIGYWRHSGTGATSRSKRMVQGVIRTVSAGSNDYPSVAAHMETGSGTHDDAALAGLVVEDDGFNHGFFVAERDDDVKVGSTTGSLPYKSHDTDYRLSTFVDGFSLTGYDHTEAETLNRTMTNISSGHAGFTQCCSTRAAEVSEFWDCQDKVITCTGLPTGHKLKVRDSGGTVLKSATESSGTATLDLIDVSLAAIEDVVATDGADTILKVFAPDGVADPFVAGGDTYQYAGLSGEVTAAGSVDAKVPGEATATGSVRAKVPSQVTSAGSVDAALAGHVSSASSVDAALPSEATAPGSVDAAVRSQATGAGSVDAALAGQATEAGSVDTALPSEVTAPASADVALPSQVDATGSVDAALQSQATSVGSVDAALTGQVSEAGSVDAALPSDVTAAGSVDAALPSQVTATGSVDASLASVDGEVTAAGSVDALQHAETTSAASVDAKVPGHVADTGSVDAALRAESTSAASVDAKAPSQATEAGSVDAKASSEQAATGSVDVAIKSEIASAGSVDAALRSQVTEAGSVDVQTTSTPSQVTAPGSVDALVAAEVTVPSSVDVALPGEATAAGSVDAALRSEQTAAGSLDAKLPGTATAAGGVRVSLAGESTAPASVDASVSSETTAAGSVDVFVAVTEIPPGGFVIVVDGPRRLRLSDRATRAILAVSPASVRLEGGMPFTLRVGETTRPLRVRLVDGDGNTPTLTGATVTFSMSPTDSSGLTIEDGACTILSASPPSDPDEANIKYDFSAADVAAAGNYRGVFKVDFGAGSIGFYPSDDNVPITIRSTLT